MSRNSVDSNSNLFVGLDIGTSKVVCLIGEIGQNDQIRIIGFGSEPSRGLKKGVVVNIESTIASIQKAVEAAELMAGCTVHSAYTGIAGNHISSLNSHGIVAIQNREIEQTDIDRVIDSARAVAIPANHKIIHILPQEFIVDQQGGIREPIGMSGVRLEAKVHIVTGGMGAAQNINKCVTQCSITPGELVLEQLASSHAVLTEDEKELGVCMVDIGGGTTDIAVFKEGAIVYTSVIPIAGTQVTKDIAIALKISMKNAEQMKLSNGAVLSEEIDPLDVIDTSDLHKSAHKPISKKAFVEIITARYEELFELILEELKKNSLENLIAAGMVLTGGASQITGCIELAEKMFQTPVRLGLPQHVEGITEVRDNPIYATGVGLLIHAYQNQDKPQPKVENSLRGIWKKIREWFQSNNDT